MNWENVQKVIPCVGQHLWLAIIPYEPFHDAGMVAINQQELYPQQHLPRGPMDKFPMDKGFCGRLEMKSHRYSRFLSHFLDHHESTPTTTGEGWQPAYLPPLTHRLRCFGALSRCPSTQPGGTPVGACDGAGDIDGCGCGS